MTEDTKLCPFCAEEIKTAAIVCKHCGRELPEFEELKPVTEHSTGVSASQRQQKNINVSSESDIKDEEVQMCPYCFEEISATATICELCDWHILENEPAADVRARGPKEGQPIPQWISYLSNTGIFLLIYFGAAAFLSLLFGEINTISVIGVFIIVIGIHFWAMFERDKYLTKNQRRAESDSIYNRRGW